MKPLVITMLPLGGNYTFRAEIHDNGELLDIVEFGEPGAKLRTRTELLDVEFDTMPTAEFINAFIGE